MRFCLVPRTWEFIGLLPLPGIAIRVASAAANYQGLSHNWVEDCAVVAAISPLGRQADMGGASRKDETWKLALRGQGSSKWTFSLTKLDHEWSCEAIQAASPFYSTSFFLSDNRWQEQHSLPLSHCTLQRWHVASIEIIQACHHFSQQKQQQTDHMQMVPRSWTPNFLPCWI